jgi:hypothetical protein
VAVAFPEEVGDAEVVALEWVNEAEVLDRLRAAAVPDLLAWLCAEYGHLQDDTLMRLYNTLLGSDQLRLTISDQRTAINLKSIRVHLHPHGVASHA